MADDDQRPLALIGQTLSHYKITAAIGAGGMGEVYRATDTKLGRDVALKVLPPEMASSPERLERFRREARAVAALNHPHIVTIYSVEEEGGVHFLTMELVLGQPLDRLIPEGGLDAERVLDIAGALADALAAAHDKGIVHRDLKPANVMVGEDGRVKVLDFGLAKFAGSGDGAEADSRLPTEMRTREGVVLGTMPYMSPEQVQGRPLDHRTDIFSLGVILYEMATGQRPFQGRSSAELASAILRDSPRPLGELRADLPERLGLVIERCLEKRAADRFPSARDVRDGLRGVTRASRPVAAPDTAVAIAVLPFSDMSPAQDQHYLCEGMAEEIMNALVRIDGIRVASRTSAFRARLEGGDLPAIARALSVGHVLEGSVRTSGSRLRVTAQLTDVGSGYQLWSKRYDRDAADVFAVQDEIAAGVFEAVKARLAPGDRTVRARPQAGNLEAYRSYLKGRYLRHTKNDHGGALRAFEEAVRLDPSHAPSWVGVAEGTVLAAHYSLIPAREACARAKEALGTAQRLQGESADALYVQGFMAFLEREWRASELAYGRALDLQPSHVQALGSFGLILCTRQRLDDALLVFERAREADPLAAFPYAITGAGLVAVGRPQDSERYFEDAFAFEKENTLALWGSGMARIAQGRFEEGIATLEQAVAVSHRAGFFLGLLGWAFAAAGRNDEARTVLRELRKRTAAAPTVVSEAWLLAALGETDTAFEVMARAEDEGQAFLYYTGLPGFDPLRADPRFGALLARLGLPSP